MNLYFYFMKDSVNLGALIEERLVELGMTKAEFARRINTSAQNVNNILRRKTMDTGLLSEIGEVLDYDFFLHLTKKAKYTSGLYNPGETNEDAMTYTDKPRIRLYLELSPGQEQKIMSLLKAEGMLDKFLDAEFGDK